jgi:hypothetical protein
MKVVIYCFTAVIVLLLTLASTSALFGATAAVTGSGPCDTIILNTGERLLVSKIRRLKGVLEVTDCAEKSIGYSIKKSIIAEVRYASGKHIDFKFRRVRKASRPFRLLGILLIVSGVLFAPFFPILALLIFIEALMAGGSYLVLSLLMYVSAFVFVLPVLLIIWGVRALRKAKREQRRLLSEGDAPSG